MVVIPARRFMMGSPAGEAERSKSEGPQHDVRIAAIPYPCPKFHRIECNFPYFYQRRFPTGKQYLCRLLPLIPIRHP